MALSANNSPKNQTLVVTIDGPAGAGKSTVAREVAKRLNIFFLDTGAMYRALTLKALRENIPLDDENALVDLAKKTTVRLTLNDNRHLKVFLDGQDVTGDIRSADVTNNTFFAARAPGVREILVGWQRRIAQEKDVVAEGRDTGTVVFPQAAKKFYLDADLKERAGRRIKELKEKGENVVEENLKTDLKDRDQKDMTRSVGPLKKADDAVIIDTTHLTVEEVVERILEYIKE